MYKVQHLYVDSTVGCYGMYKVTSHAIFHVKYACVPRAVDGIGTHNIWMGLELTISCLVCIFLTISYRLRWEVRYYPVELTCG